MKYLYLYLHLFTISYPLAQSFEHRLRYVSKWKSLFPGLIVTAAFFIIWDVIFTKNGVWGFNERYLSGLFLINLPVEEWLFFITVPFASVFIYECVHYFLPKIATSSPLKWVSLVFAIVIILIAIVNYQRAYTFWNFLFAGSFLAFVSLKNPSWLGKFYVAYALDLIPFFIVNGVLTGTWIEEEVVWYNNAENLSIRLGTIPIEDTIYALLLLLMNVYFFEHFKKKTLKQT